jgi:hypothetical protein
MSVLLVLVEDVLGCLIEWSDVTLLSASQFVHIPTRHLKQMRRLFEEYKNIPQKNLVKAYKRILNSKILVLFKGHLMM